MLELNKVYCMDNLELLKQIPDNYIDLIYCDILYGTGRNFGDYQDLKCDRKVIEEHYIPRIKEMHRVLKDTGSIYLQMDTRINHWMRCLMDDIFGYDKFRNEIAWCYRGGGVNKNKYSNKHDILLFYAKDKHIFNMQYLPYSASTCDLVNRRGGTSIDGKKRDLDRGMHITDWFSDINSLQTFSTERLKYQTQKPKALLERIIKASSNEGDTVADYYMGSGTTAEVCYDLNRNFIGCDISEKAVSIANNRIEEAKRKQQERLF